jgi:hypothetical protein
MSKPDRPSTPLEVLIGRSLAMCVHPCAAWCRHSTRGRAFIIAAYVVASYVVVFALLTVGFRDF